MKKTENTEAELDKAEEIKKLVLEKLRCQKQIEDLKEKIESLTKRMPELDLQISSLLGLVKMETPTKATGDPRFAIPKKGMVMDMAKVMSEDNPMTMDEIIQAMREQNPNVKENSIRSYLSNLECFENIRKGDKRFNNKKGWIYHKENPK